MANLKSLAKDTAIYGLSSIVGRFLNYLLVPIYTTALGEDPGTIEEVYEPFLIKEGFIKRTPRGREVTDLAYKHLGRSRYTSQRDLFGEA